MSSFLSYKSSYSSTSTNSSLKHHNTNMDNLSHDFYSRNSIIAEENNHVNNTIFNNKIPIIAKDRLESLLKQVDDDNLSLLMQNEFKTMMVDQQRLVTMLEQRAELLENENDELKLIIQDNQRRYEKAVREMQFFKKKYESLKQQVDGSSKSQQAATSAIHLQHMTESSSNSVYSHSNYNWPSSPTASVAPSILSAIEHHHHHTTTSTPITTRRRNNSNAAASIYSTMSGSTESSSIYRYENIEKKLNHAHQHQQQPYQVTRDPSMASSYSTPSSAAPSMISGASSIMSVPPPMTPVRSSTSTNGYTGNSMIQQRRTDPLTFGGSDALWDTISKSSGSDVTVEKIIRYALRR
jgi:hypothetical protein